MNTLDLVREFHDAFNVKTPDQPTIHDSEINKLRHRLIDEELNELTDAMVRCDIVGCLDALTDLQYVIDGTYLALGLAKYKDGAFAEVHRSNMSKLGADGRPIIRDDGKVLKGPNYTPPNLASVLFGEIPPCSHIFLEDSTICEICGA